MEKLILLLLGLGVFALLVNYVVKGVKKHFREERMYAVLKKMRQYPCQELDVDGRHYLVAFIPQNAHYYSENNLPFPIPEDVKDKMKVEWEHHWSVFCAVDVATIVTYLKFNPELRVLNIPTGNSDGLMCHPIYKVVRVR